MRVTDLERAMIQNIGENLMTPVNGAWPMKPEETVGWSDCLVDGPNRIEANQVGALVANLVKKGLAESFDDGEESTVHLTQAGLEVLWGLE